MSLVRLFVDVGNSRIKIGLFEGAAEREQLPICLRSLAVDAKTDLPWSRIREWRTPDNLPLNQPLGFLAGANPPVLARVLTTWPADWPSPVSVGYSATTFPLAIRLPEPQKAGIDRLLNAVAANRLRSAGQPVLIIDTGTATTIDAVDAEGAFVGGAILPGFELCAQALHDYTALLPLVSVADITPCPPEAVGTNTRAALYSGLFWGQLGAVKELLLRSNLALNSDKPLVLLTGGGGSLLAPYLSETKWLPHLSLQGLALVVSEF